MRMTRSEGKDFCVVGQRPQNINAESETSLSASVGSSTGIIGLYRPPHIVCEYSKARLKDAMSPAFKHQPMRTGR